MGALAPACDVKCELAREQFSIEGAAHSNQCYSFQYHIRLMRVFLTKWMMRYVRRERIDPASLLEAIRRAERGLIDADLGGGLIKQPVARAGKGRSGGYRTLIAYRRGDRAFFLIGFAKSKREMSSPANLRQHAKSQQS